MPQEQVRTQLKEYETNIMDADLTGSPVGDHEKELIFNCKIDDVSNSMLKNCSLFRTKLSVEEVEKALGLTMTLNCASFDEMEMSPLLFDLLLVLVMRTKGNVEKRRKLLDVVGKERVRELLAKMETIE